MKDSKMIAICLELLKVTLEDMPAKDADSIVLQVVGLLEEQLLKDK